ncbi:hypothetical protein ACM66B_004190 [Microbotryomycetes sp. NB124-2]
MSDPAQSQNQAVNDVHNMTTVVAPQDAFGTEAPSDALTVKSAQTGATEQHEQQHPALYSQPSVEHDQQARSKIVQESGIPLDDLLALPFDIVFEIFSHLDGRDLITFAESSKRTFRLMLSRPFAQLWRALRAKLELVPFKEIGDVQFVLLASGQNCQVRDADYELAPAGLTLRAKDCGLQTHKAPNWSRLERQCPDCREASSTTLDKANILVIHPSLSSALNPVWTIYEVYYNTLEMVDINRKLQHLQKEDDAEKSRVDKLNSSSGTRRSGGTRSRELKIHDPRQTFVSKLAEFVEERKQTIAAAKKVRLNYETHFVNRDEVDE